MQYVRSLGGSVSKTWNSINPATLSGAIDVIVVEQEDGSLACSPFHVRFGKFSLLRPYEKKVEFKVNSVKQNHAMKLGEAGEAFFVFETTDEIPESMQTSPVISPAASPQSLPDQDAISPPILQEPEFLDLNIDGSRDRQEDPDVFLRPMISKSLRAKSDFGALTPISTSPNSDTGAYKINARSEFDDLSLQIKRSASEELISTSSLLHEKKHDKALSVPKNSMQNNPEASPVMAISTPSERSASPLLLSAIDAVSRAKSLSKKLSMSQIPTHVSDNGDLMLDMTGYKSSEEEARHAEIIARKILAEELEGNYDIGALIGADEQGNLWIYSSEEAKEAAGRRLGVRGLVQKQTTDAAASDPVSGENEGTTSTDPEGSMKTNRTQSASLASGLVTPPQTPPENIQGGGDPNRNYAKTLRLTSDQLKAMNLKPGENSMSFSVNRATCEASMFYWTFDVPIVISDIDGTITKSDALGHVLNMIGRDWTHIGVAKLYTDIVANGYNILYLTSRSVGQADTTRTYLKGVYQEGFKLPKGAVIMSPDRTIAALRREVYLRKPEVFKMACLRDILGLFGQKKSPFYAGFGNRLTDALSYRSVNIPSTRIFTINSNAEVSLDLLTLNKYKSSYVTMREVVDHFFPPIGLLVTGGGEEFTDFNYWRETPLELEHFSDSNSNDGLSGTSSEKDKHSIKSEDEGSLDEEEEDEMMDSYISRDSIDATDERINSILEVVERTGLHIGDPTVENQENVLVDLGITDLAEQDNTSDGIT